jgi:Fe-S-cluster containining protein
MNTSLSQGLRILPGEMGLFRWDGKSQLISHAACLHCRDIVPVPCCEWKFGEGVVLFTKSEIETIRAAGYSLPEFRPYRGSDLVFRVELSPSRRDADLALCPFLDEEAYACRIYAMRPFDCWTWPFLFARGEAPGSTVIASFTLEWCPGLQEIEPEVVLAFQERMADLLSSEQYLRLIKTHPALIWEDKGEAIFPIRDVTALLEAMT